MYLTFESRERNFAPPSKLYIYAQGNERLGGIFFTKPTCRRGAWSSFERYVSELEVENIFIADKVKSITAIFAG